MRPRLDNQAHEEYDMTGTLSARATAELSAACRLRTAAAPAMMPMLAMALVGLGCAALAGCAGGGGADTRPSSKADAAAVNVQLGVDYLQQGDLQLAQDKLKRALSEDPGNADVHSGLALLDERLGESKDADREYRRALSLSGRAPKMLNNYAVYLCSHGRAAEGVRYADEASANPLYPTPWAAYTNAGICLRTLNRNTEALQRFTRALQINAGFADAVYEAASLESAEQHYVQARLRIDVFMMNNQATPALLLLGWRIAGAQNDGLGQQRYKAQLDQRFPQSGQARSLQIASGGSSPVD
jgi:type IV pilus assembly protein PilF